LSPEVFQHLLAHYGYWAIFCIVGLESVGIPLPGEMIVILASVWASQHGGNIAFVIAAAAAGAIVGDNMGYWIGREYGYKLLVKHAPRMGLTQGQLKLGQYLFQKYGVFVVFFGRFIAFLRILAAFLSGVNRLEWAKFMLANAAGGIAWASAVALTAYWLGRKAHLFHGPMAVLLAIVVVAVTIILARYVRKHEAELTAEAEKAFPGPIPGFPS